MPASVEELTYFIMSALIVVGMAAIGWLLNKGFEAIKEQLVAIRIALNTEHEERLKLRAEMQTMQRVCDERHGVPHRRWADVALKAEEGAYR